MANKETPFMRYLREIGDDELAAKKLGISQRSARAYRTGWRSPRPGTAYWIIRKARGELCLEDFYARS